MSAQRRRKARFLRVRKFFWTTFIGGLVVLLPITLFILITKLVLDFARNVVKPLTQVIEIKSISNEYLIDLIAIVLILAFCFFVGLFVQTQFGKGFFNYIDRILFDRLPFYGTIKTTVQQFTGTKKIPFSDVIMVDVFGNDTRMIGFVSDEHENGNLTLFVPTGPNPTNGFIFHVKKEQVEYLDLKPDEAMRTIIGVGAGASSLFGQVKKDTQNSK